MLQLGVNGLRSVLHLVRVPFGEGHEGLPCWWRWLPARLHLLIGNYILALSYLINRSKVTALYMPLMGI